MEVKVLTITEQLTALVFVPRTREDLKITHHNGELEYVTKSTPRREETTTGERRTASYHKVLQVYSLQG